MKTEKSHAKYSASSSERWTQCPGSIALIEHAPPQPESPYAKEGTEAHACLEYLAKNRDAPKVARAMAKMEYGEEMVKHAEVALREIDKRMVKGAELFIEVKGNLDWIAPDMGGTSDIVIAVPFGRLTVMDYKYGAGVIVDPVDNSQGITYALQEAHRHDYNFSEVEIVIIQPRGAHPDGPVRSWVTTIANLKEWAKKFKEARKAGDDPLAPLKSGDWCQFCPAKIICPETSEKAFKEAQIEFDDGVPGKLPFPVQDRPVMVGAGVLALTPERVSKILTAGKRIRNWLDSIDEYAYQLANQGTEIPGFKIVPKRAQRCWSNPKHARKQAVKLFGPVALSKPELLSPAQFEKQVPDSADFVHEFAVSVSSGTTLAPDTDKRPATNQAQLDFGVHGKTLAGHIERELSKPNRFTELVEGKTKKRSGMIEVDFLEPEKSKKCPVRKKSVVKKSTKRKRR